MRKRHSFTIIEILVVMAIIIVLMALLMTGWSVARRKAQVTQARADIALLRTAVSQYQLNYQSANMPFALGYGTASDLLLTDTSDPSIANLLVTLGGNDAAANPRRIVMLEEGIAAKDPWGNSYRVALDLNADGSLSDNVVYGSGLLQKDVAVWSRGPDGLDNATDSHGTNSDNIKSW